MLTTLSSILGVNAMTKYALIVLGVVVVVIIILKIKERG